MIDKKQHTKNIFVMGFALFAMFFGAGNLIFPPYLGFQTANRWFPAFICFILTDVGLSIFALIMLTRTGKGIEGVTDVIGKNLSRVLLIANAICLGPLIAIPRTAATTFELAVAPLFPGVSSWISAIVFFAICIVLCLKQAKVIDIIGSVLSPLMVIALAILIISGIVNPLGSVGETVRVSSIAKEGITAGYQTMDMLGGIIFSVGILLSIRQKGYHTTKEQSKITGYSGLIAAVALSLVYGGLAYLGATVSETFPEGLTQSALLVRITQQLLGKTGSALLGFIVAAACVTTSVGLLSSFSEFVTELTKGKANYKTVVIITSVISCVISNFGISTIISLAAPILDLIYPVFVDLVFLSMFSHKIKNNNVYKFSAGAAFIVNLLLLIETYSSISFGISSWPLSSLGFAWLLPAVLGAVLGLFIKDRKKA